VRGAANFGYWELTSGPPGEMDFLGILRIHVFL
jgi:hypothetical protein